MSQLSAEASQYSTLLELPRKRPLGCVHSEVASLIVGRRTQAREQLYGLRLHQSPPTKASVGLRAVALLEAAKGVVALLLGCGVLTLIHKNFDHVAERLPEVLHVNPDEKLRKLLVELASHSGGRTLWVLALGALLYAAGRLIAAYGLWREQRWAQWFELLGTALYLLPELYWLLHHPSWLRCGVLVINVVILLFMLTLRVKAVPRRIQKY